MKRRDKKTRVNFSPPSITFNFRTRRWEGIMEEDIEGWEAAYPNVEVRGELLRMGQWLLANPKRAKKNYRRFIVNWLTNEQKKKIRRPHNVDEIINRFLGVGND